MNHPPPEKGTKPDERRENKRFGLEQGAAAVLRRPWPHSTTLGRIVDISSDGLAFTYVGGEQSLHGASRLDIVWGDCSSRLREMPFEIVSDCQTAPKADFSCLEMRRCSMQFGKLTTSQKHELASFIENYSTGELQTGGNPWPGR